MTRFDEKAHILSRPQEQLWNQLGDLPGGHWILYGDTALGLRLGHRHSPDFELKSARHFNPQHLLENVAFLRGAQVLESRWSFLKVAVGGPTPVEMTFSGGQTMHQIYPPERASNGLPVASLPDLAGEKMHRIGRSITEKDCHDVVTLLYAGTSMEEMFRCAEAKYEDFEASSALLKLANATRRADLDIDQETKWVIRKEVGTTHHKSRMPVHSERLTTEIREAARPPEPHQNLERTTNPFELGR